MKEPASTCRIFWGIAGVRPAWPLVVLCTLLAIGCAKDPATPARPAAAKQARPVSVTADRGPVEITITAERDQVTVGEKFDVAIDVVADEGVAVQMPVIEESLGEFSVRQRTTPPDVPEQGKRRWKHIYVLDTFATGEVEIPGLELNYTDRRQATIDEHGEPIEAALATEPIVINVESVLAANQADEDFRDIREAVAVPTTREFDRRPIVWAILATLLVMIGAAAVLLLMRVMKRMRGPVGESVIVLPAHVRALRALDELAARNLIEQGKFHEFYFVLSDIVRQYIEDRFGLKAPERTTEEFLREAQRDWRLSEAHRDLLTQFLRTADMVKFALYSPGGEDAREALRAAREFVVETQPRETAGDGEGVQHRPAKTLAEVGA